VKILITYALEAEKGAIQISGHTLAFCQIGLGKVSAALHTYEAILREKPDLVLNIGSAGTLHHQVGEIVACVRFLDRDLEKIAHLGVPCRLDFSDEIAALFPNVVASGLVSTGDTFQTDHTETGSHADVFDMEAYAGAQACKKLGLPFLSIKYVTDIIGQNSLKHWEDKLQDAREGLAEFLKKYAF